MKAILPLGQICTDTTLTIITYLIFVADAVDIVRGEFVVNFKLVPLVGSWNIDCDCHLFQVGGGM